MLSFDAWRTSRPRRRPYSPFCVSSLPPSPIRLRTDSVLISESTGIKCFVPKSNTVCQLVLLTLLTIRMTVSTGAVDVPPLLIPSDTRASTFRPPPPPSSHHRPQVGDEEGSSLPHPGVRVAGLSASASTIHHAPTLPHTVKYLRRHPAMGSLLYRVWCESCGLGEALIFSQRSWNVTRDNGWEVLNTTLLGLPHCKICRQMAQILQSPAIARHTSSHPAFTLTFPPTQSLVDIPDHLTGSMINGAQTERCPPRACGPTCLPSSLTKD